MVTLCLRSPVTFSLYRTSEYLRQFVLEIFLRISHGATAHSGPGLPHYRGIITLRHTTLARNPLDE
jgi:hypothetical protein